MRLMRFFGASIDDLHDPAEVRAAQVASFARQTPINTAVTATTVLVTAALLLPVLSPVWVIAWAGLHTALSLHVLYRWWLYRRGPQWNRASKRTIFKASLWACASGALWGATTGFLPFVPVDQQIALIIVITAMAGGAATTLAAVPQAAVLFIVSCLLPLALFFVRQGEPVYIGLAALALIMTLGMLSATRIVYGSFIEQVRAEHASAQMLAEFSTARREWLEISETTDAFALYDSDETLLLWNESYRGTFSLPDDVLHRGTSRREVLRRCAPPVQVAEGRWSRQAWIESQMGLHDQPQARIVEQLSNGRWIRSSARRTAQGHIAVVHADITEVKRAEAAERESEHRFRALINNALDIITILAADGTILFESPSVERVLGYNPEELIGQRVFDYVHPDDLPTVMAAFQKAVQETGRAESAELRFKHKDDSWRSLEAIGRNLLHDPAVAGLVINSRDISDRKRADEALRRSEEKYRTILENMTDTFYRTDGDGRIVLASPSAARLLGFAMMEIVGRSLADLYVEPDGREAFLAALEAGGGTVSGYETQLRRKDGSTIWVATSASFVRDDAGAVVGVEGIARDISDRKHAEDALRESQVSLANAQRIAHIGNWDWEMRSNKLIWSDEVYRIFGLRPQEFGGTYEAFLDAVHPDDRILVEEHVTAAVESGEPYSIDHRIVLADGSERIVHEQGEVAFDEAGRPQQMFGTVQDITERREAERALRESESRLRLLTDAVPVLISYVDADRRYRFNNRQYEEWIGRPREEILGLRVDEVFDAEAYARFQPFLDRALAGERVVYDGMITFPDGGKRHYTAVYVPDVGPDGEVLGVSTMVEDRTERVAMEEQLRQAHKMEAIGQLTGGVAHDFNNLLAVIIGNLDMLEEKIADHPELLDMVQRALGAADRGASLTQRLLAFSRKQALRPEATDLNQLVGTMTELIRRTLGEAIEVDSVMQKGLRPCRIDRVQMENALLNLAINARDAMPRGGRLVIETANVSFDDEYAAAQADIPPGDYVMLGVSDTGTGMAAEVKERAFEPFYTTKEIGKGSGLGLSMVYGFVKQSGGHVRIYSEEGEGTTIRIYMPCTQVPDNVAGVFAGENTTAADRGETVLVVEDNADLRTLVVCVLADLGYTVLEARSGEDALAMLSDHRSIDLLVADVVLPGGMTGPDLAQRIRGELPGIKVLFMSGFARNAIFGQDELDPDKHLLNKPFKHDDLARTVRQMVSSPPP